MGMEAAIERVAFRRVGQQEKAPQQVWDLVAPPDHGGHAFARAEIWEGESQWGVRLHDRAPEMSAAQLLRVASRLLVWGIGCPADTVEVVLARDHSRHLLIRTGADYV